MKLLTPPPLNLKLIELEAGQCRYPYGDRAMTFCGHPVFRGSSYCEAHFWLCCGSARVLNGFIHTDQQ